MAEPSMDGNVQFLEPTIEDLPKTKVMDTSKAIYHIYPRNNYMARIRTGSAASHLDLSSANQMNTQEQYYIYSSRPARLLHNLLIKLIRPKKKHAEP